MISNLARHSAVSFALRLANPGKIMAFCAHATTAMTFGAAIYAWFFPDVASVYLAKIIRQVDQANEQLGTLAQSSEETASNTARLVEAVADRPRLTISRHGNGRNGDALTQLAIQNMTTSTLTDAVIVWLGPDSRKLTSFEVFSIPPLEVAHDQHYSSVEGLCYSFVLGGERYTEYRTFMFNDLPTVDDNGNAATFDTKTLDYAFTVEADSGSITCDDTVTPVEEIRAQRAAMQQG